MLLVLHIIVALASVVAGGWAVLAPSRVKLRASYELSILTLVSGTYLVLHTHVPLTPACLSGILYLAVVSAEIATAHRRLAKETI